MKENKTKIFEHTEISCIGICLAKVYLRQYQISTNEQKILVYFKFSPLTWERKEHEHLNLTVPSVTVASHVVQLLHLSLALTSCPMLGGNVKCERLELKDLH